MTKTACLAATNTNVGVIWDRKVEAEAGNTYYA